MKTTSDRATVYLGACCCAFMFGLGTASGMLLAGHIGWAAYIAATLASFASFAAFSLIKHRAHTREMADWDRVAETTWARSRHLERLLASAKACGLRPANDETRITLQ